MTEGSEARPAVRSSRMAGLARYAPWLPVALVVLAEAAWISVLEGFFQAFAQRPPVLGVHALALFVVAGLVAARVVGRRLGGRWPVVALAMIGIAGALGVLMASQARAALPGGPMLALAAYPGGIVAGLALLRGFAHARLPLEEGTVGRLIGLGVPGLALLAVIGSVAPEPARTMFLAEAFRAAVVFVASGVLAMTLARLTAIGEGTGIDWRRNPVWLGVMTAVLVLAVALAVPLSAVAGRVIEALVTIALVPMLVIGLTMGLDRTGRRVIAFVVGGGALVFVILSTFGGQVGVGPEPPPEGEVAQQPTAADDLLSAGLGGVLLVVSVVVVLLLVALWMRRGRAPAEDLVEETRRIDRGAVPVRKRRRSWGRRTEPTSAAGAYVALVEDLDRHPDVRAGEAETPAEHAARLRASGRADLRLDLLAADYALARYAGVELPQREDRRAVGRWRALRRALTRPLKGSPGGPAGAR